MRVTGLQADRIWQTLGEAPASGGTHRQDGVVDGVAYSAATDIDVSDLDEHQIRVLLERLGRMGFAAWYRQPGYDSWPVTELPHIHAVYAACEMKLLLRLQVSSWLAGGNGMLDNAPYAFYSWSDTANEAVRSSFEASGGAMQD